MLHPYDCPVKTDHMIGVLIRFESKEYSEYATIYTTKLGN